MFSDKNELKVQMYPVFQQSFLSKQILREGISLSSTCTIIGRSFSEINSYTFSDDLSNPIIDGVCKFHPFVPVSVRLRCMRPVIFTLILLRKPTSSGGMSIAA